MKTYKCPVCKKTLTKKEFEAALGMLGEREKHLQHEKSDLERKLREVPVKVKHARDEGVRTERARTQRLLSGKDKQIDILKQRIDQLKKGTTPQTEGLEFEEKLSSRLQKEFRDDEILHKGKGGDVLHIVKFDGKPAGIIIYECKRTPRIQEQHVQQARLAKQTREADFAVLVTTGQKRGFSGLLQMSGVLVVSPLGTIPLASLLRAHLIEMVRAKIAKEKRVVIAQQLLKHVTSPQFRNPIEEIVQLSVQLQHMIKEEAKDHFRLWKKRWDHYQKIQWDGSQVQQNIQLVLHGKEPKLIPPLKIVPMELPSPSE